MEDNFKKISNIYDDFFNSSLDTKKDDIPLEKNDTNYDSKEKLFERIDNLYITEKSKDLLKKCIVYMQKYKEQIIKDYISFNFSMFVENRKIIIEIANIIRDANLSYNYFQKTDTAEVSLYDLKEIKQYEEVYGRNNGVVVITDFKAITDTHLKNALSDSIKRMIDENEKKSITIVNFSNNAEYEEFFESDIKNIFEGFYLQEEKPGVQDIYQDLIDTFSKNNELSDDFKVKLLDYVTATYPKTSKKYFEYIENLTKEILLNKNFDEKMLNENHIPKYEKEKTLEEVFAELDELVGLEEIKKSLRDLADFIELKKKTEGTLKIKDINLHMIFLGNPGTGKTTVARMVSSILYNLGMIKEDKLIEVTSKDLVGEYLGQTAPKTNAVLQKALGGLLFIDEAYTLGETGNGNTYNAEAIATLIQGMENNRDNLVVIFAGYTKEMQAFLNANSGIVSRIGYTLNFKDYTEDELLKIFKGMTKKAGFSVKKDAEDKIKEIIKEYKYTKNFGNARFIRNLYEKTIIKHATNTKNSNSKKVLKTITKEDISVENLIKQ